MKNAFLLVAILFFCSFVKVEQYMQAKIIFRNDGVITGLASLPNDPPDATIFYKEDKKAESRKIVYTELVAKVMTGGYKWSDMEQIVNEYNQKKKRA